MKAASKLILIIEDDAVFRRGLKRFFSNESYTVIDFEDAEKASHEIIESKPDLILCDYVLPGINGLEFLKELRKNGNQTPFFLITGYFTEELSQLANLNGADATLEKPIDLKILKSCFKLES